MGFKMFTVEELIHKEIIEPPMDGNHGGIHPKGPDFIEEGIPFISAADITDDNLDLKNCKFISLEKAKSLKKGFSKTGDVLLTHKATIGRTAIVPEMKYDFIVLSPQVTYYRIIKRDKLDPYYLKDYFNSYHFQAMFKNWAGSGSTRSYLGITAQKKLLLQLQSIAVQKEIVQIVNPIRKNIEINSKIINNLEELAQTLFKHWFVDFEFPNENGEPYKSSGGKMVESELGMIPEDWEVKSLSEIANFQNGLAMQKFRPEENEESLPVLKIKELRQGSTNNDSDRCSVNIRDSVKVFNGDVIFSWSASLLVRLWIGGNAGLNQHLFKVTSEDFPKWFYYMWTKHYLDEFNAIAKDKATTMGHIKRSHLNESKVVIPPNRELEELTKIIGPFINKKVKLAEENKSLIEIRDTLLPKLLSGEIELQESMEVTDDVPVS